jgi:hypothetical protein
MPSTIGWLDTTHEQQRVARELVELFMQPESRDELGIAQIRDVLSNWLFPGTSVLQARARYFVLVPWCYQVAEDRKRRKPALDLRATARDVQRDMLDVMKRDHPDADGLIGKQLGRRVKGLPSDLFWSGLETFDIHRSDLEVPRENPRDEGEVTELASRTPTQWDPNVPKKPKDFPHTVPYGLDMSAAEAEWLAERMRNGREHTYLAHLLTLDPHIVTAAPTPWDVPTERVFVELGHASRFSHVMHGASLIYNLLLAQRYQATTELTRLDGDDLVDDYAAQIEEWALTTDGSNGTQGWDFLGFREDVAQRNPRISRRTWDFVSAWVGMVDKMGPSAAARSQAAAELIARREQRKGSKSRLSGNVRMLDSWGGASGTGRLSYRWATIQTLVEDINGGHGTQKDADADA